MTTQYTSILKLALPVQGELSGTWGDVVNDNITSMIEEAIAGRSVINTWTANAHTLTTADGTTSESRAAMLEFTDTGAVLSGNAEVICPTASKIYIAKNAVGSSRTVTLKTSAGTGIAIPDATTMLLFCDGTNVVEAVTNINSLSVGGYTVTLAGAVSTAAAFSTAGANALTLTTTGTTNVTLPTTGTLATLAGTETFTNKTLTSPDINGGSVDNATIGATTPSTGVFTNLTANTDLTLATGATVTGINTTTDMSDASTTTLATSDSIKQYVDAQVGANNELSEVLANGNTTGANNIIVDAGQSITTDSILETTAAAGVDIDGILLKDTSVGTDDASGTDIAGTNVTLRGGAGTGTGAGGSLIFQTAPAGSTGSTVNTQVTAMTIDSTGAVDMNVSLNVDGTVTADGLTVDGTSQFNTGAAGIAEFYHTSGYGGIKTTGSATGSGATVYLSNDKAGTPFDIYTIFADGSDDSLQFWSGGNPSSGTKRFNAASNGDISFYEDTGTTAKLFWDASAESLGIGTTSPAYTLHTKSSSGGVGLIESTSSNSDLYFKDSGTTYNYSNGIGSVGNSLRFRTGDGTERLRIDASGRVGIGRTPLNKQLEVEGTTSNYNTMLVADSASGTTGTGGGIGFQSDNGAGVSVLVAAIQGIKENSTSADQSGALVFAVKSPSPHTVDEAMRIDSVGNVGIGTASPDNLLHLHGSPIIRMTTATTGEAATDGLIFGSNLDGSSFLWTYENEHLYFGTNNTERVRITEAGNVGIGTSSPSAKLGVNATAPDFTFLQSDVVKFRSGVSGTTNGGVTGSASGDYFARTTGGKMLFSIDDGVTAHAVIDSSGNVGIGTASPTFASGYSGLHINKDYPEIHLTNTNSGATASDGFKIQQNSASNVFLWNYENAFLAIGTNNTERMRIDSSGNLLVGGTTAATKVTLNKTAFLGSSTLGSATDSTFTIDVRGNLSTDIVAGEFLGGYLLDAYDSASASGAGISKFNGMHFVAGGNFGPSASDVDLVFATGLNGNATEKMRIDSSGNVGIGVVPETWLSTYDALQIGASGVLASISSGNENVLLMSNAYLGTDGNYKYIATNEATRYTQSAGVHYWFNAASGTADSTISFSQAMTLDASGNLLVGTTSATLYNSTSETGINLATDGGLYVAADGTALPNFNRVGSDGDIMRFRKDGTIVGSIGSVSGGVELDSANGALYLNKGNTGGLVLLNSSGSVSPRIDPDTDNLVDLGEAASRFKDLYLSGGVYLGGTGAANYLDDYEEGTFTATLRGGTGEPGTLITTIGRYTKIGELVSIRIGYENVDTTGYSGGMSVEGCPFTNSSNVRAMLSVGHYQTTTWNSGEIPIAQLGISATTIILQNTISGTVWTGNTHSAGTSRFMWITGVYET